MDKICKIFEKDFSYFTDDVVFNNNVTESTGMIGINHGTVHLCPENLLEEFKKIIENNKTKDEKIKFLEEQIESLKKSI